jgi:ABC-type glycerol-3-phosphate transport system substrate-binding protein
MFRKVLVVVTLVLLVGLVFAGFAQAAAREVTLTIWGWNINITAYKAAYVEFVKKNPTIKMNAPEMAFNDVHDKLLTSLAAGTGAPDISNVEQTRVPLFAVGGGLLDMTSRISKYKNDFVRYAYDAGISDGKVYATPWDVGPSAIYYRKDIFDKAGAAPPKSWDEFIVTGKKVTADTNGDGKIDQYMLPMGPSDSRIFAMFLHSRGGNFFNEKGDLILDRPEVLDTLQWYTDLALKHNIGLLQAFWEPAWFNAFKEGRIATIPIAVWFSGQIKEQAPDLAGKWRITPWPTPTGKPGGANWGGSSMVIPEQGKNKEEAWKMVEFFLATKEGQLAMYKATNIFPAFYPALKDKTFDEPDPYYGGQPIGRIFIDALPNYTTWYYTKNWLIAETGLNSAIAKILSKQATPKEALDAAIREIRAGMQR